MYLIIIVINADWEILYDTEMKLLLSNLIYT